VAVVTNAGGPGIIITDACEGAACRWPSCRPETQARLRENLPEEASVRNPVDMIATATPESYRLALEAVLADPNVDAAIAAFVPPLRVRQQDVARSIVAARARTPDKPMLAVLMGRAGLPEGRADLWDAGVPGYIFPESAARALAAMYRYRSGWSGRPARSAASTWTATTVVAGIIEQGARPAPTTSSATTCSRSSTRTAFDAAAAPCRHGR
jgi:acetate---CoA ligase (ADP-forming)